MNAYIECLTAAALTMLVVFMGFAMVLIVVAVFSADEYDDPDRDEK